MLLSMEHLTKHQNIKCIVDDVSFTIEEHDKIAVIGVNGVGKSTLLKIIAQQETYEKGECIRKNGLTISYLSQDSIFDESQDVLTHVMSQDDKIHEYEAKAILNKLGITQYHQCIKELSGGQKKRVALACALLKSCDLLILDEPTNHLDNEMIEWLEQYLKKFTKAICMVTHDRYFLERVCTKMLEIDHYKVYTYEANYSMYLEMKEQRRQVAIAQDKKRANLLRKELAWMRAGVQARGTKSRDRIARFHELNEQKNYQEQASVTLDTLSSRLGKQIMEWEQLEKRYGERTLFRNFSYTVARNDRIGVIGANGCGKSTLLKILAKELEADQGTLLHGDTVKLAFYKQGVEDMDPNERVIDYIRKTSNEIQTSEGSFSASIMLERFLFDKTLQYQYIKYLSGGEKRRLYLLKILMEAPNVLLLDEPTNDLDIQTLQILEDYLDQFPGVIICVSHDRYFLDRVCDKLFVFDENKEINQHIGGYSSYIDTSNQKQQKVIKTDTKKQSVIRMTTKEKQELETIDQVMEEIQNQIQMIDDKMATCMEDFTQLQVLSDQRMLLEQQLEEKMERWEYLVEKQQEVENSKRKA